MLLPGKSKTSAGWFCSELLELCDSCYLFFFGLFSWTWTFVALVNTVFFFFFFQNLPLPRSISSTNFICLNIASRGWRRKIQDKDAFALLLQTFSWIQTATPFLDPFSASAGEQRWRGWDFLLHAKECFVVKQSTQKNKRKSDKEVVFMYTWIFQMCKMSAFW